jgi:two-component system, NtrC family, response regulator AtoC
MGNVLVVDDKEGIRTFIAEVLSDAGHDVETAKDGKDALAKLGKRSFHLMISDLKMPNMDGMQLLEKARTIAPEMAVIVLTAHGTVDTAVAAMKMGAFDYLMKPLSGPDELQMLVSRALDHRVTYMGSITAGEEASDMVAEDPKMKAVLSLISKVAVTDATVLLLGESGTGKEVAAREIHRQSRRSNAPFVPINCAAISETLVESEMFGHEKGAYTGASERRVGRFEQADSGTLFLDEVGELPLGLQAKLLRVLQEQSFERVGGNRTISVNVRVIAATNRHLETEIQGGRFREDLFHRISVFPIKLPPLRERRRDIPILTAHLLKEIAGRLNRPRLSLAKSALNDLTAYSWPGNVRELANTLERAAIIAGADQIETAHLGLGDVAATASELSKPPSSLREMEREAIRQALAETDGHRKKAAEKLGIGLRTLYNKLKEYGLD